MKRYVEGNLMQLSLLCSENCPRLKQWIEENYNYLSSDTINERIKLMGHHVLSDLLSTIREAVRFAIIADEATDISHKEQLCKAIRWVDQNLMSMKML